MDPNDASSRFSPITATDKSGSLWIVTILALIYTAMACTVRVRVKWGIYGVEDCLFGLAVVRVPPAGVGPRTTRRGLCGLTGFQCLFAAETAVVISGLHHGHVMAEAVHPTMPGEESGQVG